MNLPNHRLEMPDARFCRPPFQSRVVVNLSGRACTAAKREGGY